MTRLAKIVALVIVIAVGASPLATQVLLSHAEPSQRAAGCHEHGSKVPAPRPTNYECCVIGHNTAVPQAAHSFEPLLPNAHVELIGEALVNSLEARREKTFTSSGSPPGVTPLRI